MKTQLLKVKNFVTGHKETIVVAVLATLAITTQHKALRQRDEFIAEKGLYDEFHNVA